MKKAYQKSLQMIKKYNIQNVKDYIKLAKKYTLLNNISLEFISGKTFDELIA